MDFDPIKINPDIKYGNHDGLEDDVDAFEIPDTIYLQCHDDDGELLPSNDPYITWCKDDTDGHNVKYVRVI